MSSVAKMRVSSELPMINPAYVEASKSMPEPEIVEIGDNRVFENIGAVIKIIPAAPSYDPFLSNSNHLELEKNSIFIPVVGTISEMREKISNALSDYMKDNDSLDASIIISGAKGSNWRMKIAGGDDLKTPEGILNQVVKMIEKGDAYKVFDKLLVPKTAPSL